eukprot:TRINITY_DN754_c0_g1_i2.p1 TRINITY_DN754_c0_g1~~TRINITY_DN754_c0_g1_i2.p1  ORF type:complete len:911 (-),score=194.13 TRINITY_DN754_c0_g1_i2:586-3318(-)
MPSWWRKSISKELKKKGSKDNIFDSLHIPKLKCSSEEKPKFKSCRRGTLPPTPEKDLGHEVDSSPSPSNFVSRSQSFAERSQGQPLPLPSALSRTESGPESIATRNQSSENRSGKLSPRLPLPSPDEVLNRLDIGDGVVGSVSGSVSSASSEGSNEATGLQLDNGLGHEGYKQSDVTFSGVPNAGSSGVPGAMRSAQSSKLSRSPKQDILKPGSAHSSRQCSLSPRKGFLNSEFLTQFQVPASAPESSMSSPSRSPLRVYGSEQSPNNAIWASKPYPEAVLFSSGHCSSPGSGHNSGQNSMGGEMIGQPLRHHAKGSPECSPIPSPRMTSGPSSRVQSGAVTPLHPQAVGANSESPTNWPEEGKHTGHRLPLPPISVSNQVPSTIPRSPGRADNPPSPGPRWKKGRLLGRGTFGYVYAGLNSETGKMCAMKEVTLFSDDPKSKESVKQLSQEIAMLSRLCHKNIVQYYGSETVDDKLYIYLEYVSGGSIHKLLQEYGQFEEPVIRGYTRQILAGLAYLHSKSTVHRDIKGANILVDPCGQVKLADFGMAKHITAHSCLLSFKGSPYWMAPEVIKNMNGYDLRVDIWSLGCTVIEMATAKPPWSQYEGVAAMFKIWNSKELPTIPDHLSEEGKEFVRLCLQREPSCRPTAFELLEHPFVKNAQAYVRLDHTQVSEILQPSANLDQSMYVNHAVHTRNVTLVDAESATRLKGILSPQHSSECSHLPRNISLPVSPSASPLHQPLSPHNRSGIRSPSPVSTPLARSGSSTPLTGGLGAIPFQMNGPVRHSMYVDDGLGNLSRSPNGLYGNGCLNGTYNDSRQDLYNGTSKSHTPPPEPSTLQDQVAVENDILGKAFGRLSRGSNFDVQKQYGGQAALAEHVSKQLLKFPAKLPGIDLRPGSPLLGRAAGYDHY